jgi:hypothetical protein
MAKKVTVVKKDKEPKKRTGFASARKTLRKSKDKDFVKRMYDKDPQVVPGTSRASKAPKSEDWKSTGTHLMASDRINGKPAAFPTIVRDSTGNLREIKDFKKDIVDKNEYITFRNDRQANRFAEGSWKSKSKQRKGSLNIAKVPKRKLK